MTTATSERPAASDETRIRLRAGVLSVTVGVLLLGVKFVGYYLTGSAAVLSDALESIVNVVAAAFALGSLRFAGQPADRDHPYGHGKIEYFSAAFEGGLIAFAAATIVWYAVHDLVRGPAVAAVEVGVLVTAGTGVANAALGAYLLRTGRRTRSATLVADGHHVLSDFWTSAGVVVGLVLVRVTGITWFDPVVALLVGLNLARTGLGIVRGAAGALLDAVDPSLLARVVAAMERCRRPGIIRVHRMRAIRSGGSTHVDAHLIVPEYWTVEQAHETSVAFEQRIVATGALHGDIAFHVDPCWRSWCVSCDLADCPVRQVAFAARAPLSLAEAVEDDPQRFGD
ncbi:MAG: cation transporter [bacterium]|nr:cation transporter [bacterium]